jgi:hypothetical protein
MLMVVARTPEAVGLKVMVIAQLDPDVNELLLDPQTPVVDEAMVKSPEFPPLVETAMLESVEAPVLLSVIDCVPLDAPIATGPNTSASVLPVGITCELLGTYIVATWPKRAEGSRQKAVSSNADASAFLTPDT